MFRESPTRRSPHDQEQGWLRWQVVDDLTFRGTWAQGVAGFPVCNGPVTAQTPDGSHHLGAVTYHDIRASWKVPVSTPFTLSAGVNSVFDKDPPVCLSCSLNG